MYSYRIEISNKVNRLRPENGLRIRSEMRAPNALKWTWNVPAGTPKWELH